MARRIIVHLPTCLGTSSQKNEMQEESALDGLDLQLIKNLYVHG